MEQKPPPIEPPMTLCRMKSPRQRVFVLITAEALLFKNMTTAVRVWGLSSQLVHHPRHAAQEAAHPLLHLPVKIRLLHLHLSSRRQKSLALFEFVSEAAVDARRGCARVLAVGRGAGGQLLASGLVPEEAVPPNDLLPAEAALVGPQPSVSLEVLGQMVLHLEGLCANGAAEGP